MDVGVLAVLTIVKTRLKIDTTEHDEMIKMYICEVGYKIMDYCNISEVPQPLMYLWATMTIDILRVEQSNIQEIADSISKSVSSTKIDNTTVSYSDTSIVTGNKAGLQEFIFNYKKQLNKYRRLPR